jgi:hypothetical protein
MTSIAAQAGGLQTSIFQVISPGTSSQVAIGAASVQGSAPSDGVTILRFFATADCYLAFGANPTASSSAMFLPAGFIEYFEIKAGEKYAVIQANSTTGTLYVTEGSTS